MAYARIKKRSVTVTTTLKDGSKVKRKETKYYPTIMYQGRELGLGSYRTQESAKAAIRRADANIANGKHPKWRPQQDKKVSELWEKMLETGQTTGTWRQSTIDLYTVTYKVHIKPVFGQRFLSDITREDIQTWVNGLCVKKNQRGESLADDTVDRICRQLRHMLKEAKDAGFITESPYKNISKPSPNQSEMDCPNVEEVARVLDKMDAKPRAYFHILAYGGLRAGEGLALKRKDLDFEKGEIHVSHSWSAANGFFKPKTAAAIRSVPMLSVLKKALQEYCENEGPFGPEDFLFQSPRAEDGSPMKTPFRSHLNKALAACGIRHVNVHSFRHFFASLMARRAGVVGLSKLMGHKNVTTTLNRYSHLFPQDLDMAICNANEVVEEAHRKVHEGDEKDENNEEEHE